MNYLLPYFSDFVRGPETGFGETWSNFLQRDFWGTWRLAGLKGPMLSAVRFQTAAERMLWS
jgi:hypothetical protein